MFGQPKPVVFERYGRRRSSWRLPRWLVLLLVGGALGAAGVLLVQERYLPPRLSATASTQLRSDFDAADAERTRLKGELADTAARLKTALADKDRQTQELAQGRATAERARDDVAAVVSALPPDPRGGVVEVRAARFSAKGSVLSYDIVLTRERDGGKSMSGALQLVVAGETARGTPASISAEPVPLAIGGHAVVRGSVNLPEGFKPGQATVQVLDRVGGKLLGMRVLRVS